VAGRNQTEGIEQAKAVAWAQSQIATVPEYRFLFHTPNGGARNPVVAQQLTAMGVRRGVPDLLWPLHRSAKHGLAIEMKSSKGALTPEQKEWLSYLTGQGWICTVARSAQEAIEALAAYHAGAFDSIACVAP